MSHDSTTETSTDNFWPELTTDVARTHTVPRSVTLDTVSASSDGRILEVTSQLEVIRTRLNSLEQFVLEAPLNSTIDASVHDRIGEMELSIISTSTRFDELASRLVKSDETVATTVINSVDGFDTRIALIEDARLAQGKELNELTGYLEQAFSRITELAQIIETNNDIHVSRIGDLEGHLEETQTRASLSALESAIADIDKRAEESHSTLQSRLADMQQAATAPLVELQGQVDAHADRLVQHGERFQSVETQIHKQLERLDKHEQELAHQYEDLARLRSFEQAQVSRFEGVEETLESRKAQIGAIDDTLQAHTTQINAQSQDIAEIQSRLELLQSDQQITEVPEIGHLARNNADRLTAIAGTADILGQRIDLAEASGNETSEKVTKQTEALDELESRLDQLENGASSAEPVAADTSQIEADLEAAQSRIADVESTTLDLSSALESESSSLREELTNLSERIDDVNTAHVAPIASDERVSDIETSVEETRQLADSLRAIQAEVVQTIQGELNNQQTRIANLEQSETSMQEAEGKFASSERLEQLETKLVEALQTISQLTQLQRRHTAVETQLTDALSASNDGIGNTQQHVVILRTELETANKRIARLEEALTAATGQAADTTPAAPAAPAPAAASAPVAPTPPAVPASADSVDTNWFDESFDQRRAS